MKEVWTAMLCAALFTGPTALAGKGGEPGVGGKIANVGKQAGKAGDKAVRNTAKVFKYVGKKASDGVDAAGNATSRALKKATSPKP